MKIWSPPIYDFFNTDGQLMFKNGVIYFFNCRRLMSLRFFSLSSFFFLGLLNVLIYLQRKTLASLSLSFLLLKWQLQNKLLSTCIVFIPSLLAFLNQVSWLRLNTLETKSAHFLVVDIFMVFFIGRPFFRYLLNGIRKSLSLENRLYLCSLKNLVIIF